MNIKFITTVPFFIMNITVIIYFVNFLCIYTFECILAFVAEDLNAFLMLFLYRKVKYFRQSTSYMSDVQVI